MNQPWKYCIILSKGFQQQSISICASKMLSKILKKREKGMLGETARERTRKQMESGKNDET